MKKIFLVLTVMAATTFFAAAQNSMEFSRVLLVETLDSVPQGKIWKVTNILPTLDQLTYAISGGCVIPDTRTNNQIWTRTFNSYQAYAGALNFNPLANAATRQVQLHGADGYSTNILKCRCIR